MCNFCEGKTSICSSYHKFHIGQLGSSYVLNCTLDKCPPHATCCNKDINVSGMMIVKYCPECGRKLVQDEA